MEMRRLAIAIGEGDGITSTIVSGTLRGTVGQENLDGITHRVVSYARDIADWADEFDDSAKVIQYVASSVSYPICHGLQDAISVSLALDRPEWVLDFSKIAVSI